MLEDLWEMNDSKSAWHHNRIVNDWNCMARSMVVDLKSFTSTSLPSWPIT